MAETEDTLKTELEGQPEATAKPAVEQPPPQEPTPEASGDGLSPKQGETLEAYSARIRNEVSWRDRQLTQQHKRIKDRDAKAIEIEQELQRFKESRPTEQPTPPAPPQPQVRPPQPSLPPDAIAAARIQIEMERTEAALIKNPEWPAALANFQRVGGIPQDFMNAVLDTDDPAYVLVALGRDMNKFTQLMELPEGKRRAALIKIGMEPDQKAAVPAKEAPKTKPSEAPAPTRSLPAGGGSTPLTGDHFDPDADCRVDASSRQNDPGKFNSDEYDAAWYAQRAQQKANSKNRPWSPGRSTPR